MKTKLLAIIVVLSTAVLSFGMVAGAQTTSVQALIAQLQAQIQVLLQQIAQLRAQQGATTAWCHTFNTNLGVGSRKNGADEDLDSLEFALNNKEGIYIPQFGNGHAGNGMSPIFDEDVAAAVVKFQAKYGIRQTGFVGPLTRAKLNALYGCAAVNPGQQCKIDPDCPQPDIYCEKSPSCPVNKCINGACKIINVVNENICTPNWTCGWGACTNGYQSQIPVDSNNCGVTTGNNIACPALARACATGQAQANCVPPAF